MIEDEKTREEVAREINQPKGPEIREELEKVIHSIWGVEEEE